MEEEFSFPAIAVDQSCASPFWFQPPPKVAGDHWSCSTMATEEDHKTGAGTGTDDEYEERMGMLWEDFNEELHRLSCERVGQSRCRKVVVVDRRRTSTRLASILKAMLKRLLILHRDRSPTGSCYRISVVD